MIRYLALIYAFFWPFSLASCDDDTKREWVSIVESTPENLGQVPLSSDASRSVTIRNNSVVAVNLGIQMLSCGCLDASFDRLSIAPGEEAVFTMKTTVLAERGEQAMVAMLWAAPEGHELAPQLIRVDLVFESDVPYFVHPLRVILHHEVGKPARSTVQLTPQSKDRIEVVEATVNIDGVDVVIGDSFEAAMGQGASLVVQSRLSEPGSYSGFLRVRTDSTEHPEFGLPLFIRVEEAGGAAPDTLILNGAGGEPTARDSVRVERALLPEGVDLKDVTFELANAAAGLGADAAIDGEALIFTVTCDFTSVSPPFGEAMLLILGPDRAVLRMSPILWISDLDLLEIDPASAAPETPETPEPPEAPEAEAEVDAMHAG